MFWSIERVAPHEHPIADLDPAAIAEHRSRAAGRDVAGA